LDGKALKEDHSFSFNTIESTQVFLVQAALMIDVDGPNPGLSLPFENNSYPDVITGVEKDMELQIMFNTGFYLNTVEDTFSITPYINHSLEKADNNVLRVLFNEPMTLEETYRATVDRSTSNVYGVTLDRDYAFEWTVDGQNSLFIRPAKISVLSPEWSPDDDPGTQNTEILNENGIFHNQEMPYRFISDEACNLVSFEIQFSTAPETGSPQNTYQYPENNIDVFRSLDKFSLIYQYGDFLPKHGKLAGYNWQPSDDLSEDEPDTLTIDFKLDVPTFEGTAFYKFVIQGGENGIVDTSGNYMEETIEIYVEYTYSN
jgi:hypothetical protein